jgi:hypothetical protein
LLARLALLPYAVSSLRLLRRRGQHEAGDVRQPAVTAARAAGLDGLRARVEADDARTPVGRHSLSSESPFESVQADERESPSSRLSLKTV